MLSWALLLLFVVISRFWGLNWDQGQHLHPDERFLVMVSQSINLPSSLSDYLSTSGSKSNPHNAGHDFYVYGTYPVILTKSLASVLGMDSYFSLPLVGRSISAVLDTVIVILVFLVARFIFSSWKSGMLSAFVYASLVIPIQLSHFFAVDTFLVSFLLLALYLLLRLSQNTSQRWLSVVGGASFALALASKVSAIAFTPFFVLLLLIKKRDVGWKTVVINLFLFGLSSLITFRLAAPYYFINLIHPNPKIIANLNTLKSLEKKEVMFPPSVQWFETKPLTYSLPNLFFVGVGPFLSVIILFSLARFLVGKDSLPRILAIMVIILFVFQDIQFARPLRYFYPILPLAAIIAGPFLVPLFTKKRLGLSVAASVIMVLPGVMFLSIYSVPHTRVQASSWIYENIPSGSTLSCEYWDDCLPLINDGRFKVIELPFYEPDSPEKWQNLDKKLASLDYLILSSNRLYGSISTVPKLYPQSSLFYSKLFLGNSPFVHVRSFTSRPNLPIPFINYCIVPPALHYGRIAENISDCPIGISLVDDYADESYTVYDHPRVSIFKNSTKSSTF